MIHLSILIPAFGRQSEVEDTLVSVLENRPADCEVVLVHDSDYSDPYDLGDEVRFVEFDASAHLDAKSSSTDALPLAFFNTGIAESTGEVIHTLLPGTTVGPGWCEAALQLFQEDRNIGSVAPCIVARGSRRTIQGVVYNSTRGKRIIHNSKRRILAPLMGTGFFQASALKFMHGFETRFGAYGDVELGLRTKSANYKAAKCDSRIYSNAKQKFRPILGYRGGKLRGELHAKARRVGLATGRQALFGLLTEPLNNRLRFGGIGSTLGRLVALCSRSSSSVLSIDRSKRAKNETREKHDAA